MNNTCIPTYPVISNFQFNQKTTNGPKVNTTPNFPNLVLPGINDHNVVLFKGTQKDTVSFSSKDTMVNAYDEVEKNSMNIFKNVAPSVVQVKNMFTQVVMNPMTGQKQEMPGGGTGSGSILDKAGHVLTNFHVINRAEKLSVFLDKETEVPCKLVGADPSTDLALLKIDLPKEKLAKLPIMKMGSSSDTEGGQRVFAIGNPFGLFRTMTQGIVSAVGRTINGVDGRLTKNVLQTDASINPGNSGGALVNANGEQVGVNAQIYSPSGASAGLGFAIPIDKAMEVVEDLKVLGRVIRPFVGVSGGLPLEALPPQLIKMLGLEEAGIKEGVILQAVAPGGPAEKAGLKGATMAIQDMQGNQMGINGDIITKVNDKPVSNMTEIFEILDECKPGQQLKVEYVQLEIEPEGDAIKGIPSEPQTVLITIEKTPDPREKDKPKDVQINEGGPKPLPLEDHLKDFGIRP